MSIEKGVLYVVATPIGNLDDLSTRAVNTLQAVDLIAAEDTRHSRPLLRHFGIKTAQIALHEHNEHELMPRLLGQLQDGRSIALISDAGTPLISDPGFPLVRECHRQGVRVSPVPGPSAAICALSAAGLPSDRFLFEGFLPRTHAARCERLQRLKQEPATLVFYESNHRVAESLQDMCSVLGIERPALMARELTKLHETLISAPLEELLQQVNADPMQRKGEIVLLVAGAKPEADAGQAAETTRILEILLKELPVKQAAALTAQITGEKKNRLYQAALALRNLKPM
ncbi:MAG: 16S rRNA (cytidine(1402)-2'-O)-methyltransferase [Candidatus Polarisedimenticolaceae bacterium]|nr:16S rRNA (cytidine(1402)-2'-O)-methyltransferase [Candidatus Polarisedimenticolaceae bacterium]